MTPSKAGDEGTSDAGSPGDDSIVVQLVGVPIELFRRSADYHEELVRECSLLLVRDPSHELNAPTDLLRLASQLREQYEPVLTPESQVDAAKSRGERTADLSLSLPRSAGEGVRRLGELFDAAETYSSEGKLLTVPPPIEVSDFRHWFIAEILSQLDGSGPRAWPCR